MIIADPILRPKRKYTFSDRALASCRLNLEHANAVPAEIRFRPTEKRRQACHRNLKLALIAKKRDRSVGYAPSFRHGWYVSDPERALPLVGATPEEYHRHLEAWRREVNPRDASEEKFAHALGILSWRWLAAVRLEGDRETLAVYRMLDDLAAERRPGQASGHFPGLPPEQAEGQAAPLPLNAARLSELRCEIDEALGEWDELITPLGKIQDRMLRVWQELLRLRGEPPMDPVMIGGGRRHEIVLSHEIQTPYALGGPFQSSRRTEEALRREPAPLQLPMHWRNPPSPAGITNSGAHSEGAPGNHAFPASIEAREAAMLREARRLGQRLPGDFEDFFRLVQAAIGTGAPGAGAMWLGRVRNFARALWERLGALRRHAEETAAWLEQRLGDYATRLWPEAPPRPERGRLEILLGLKQETISRDKERGEDLGQFYNQRIREALRGIGRLRRRVPDMFRRLLRKGRKSKSELEI